MNVTFFFIPFAGVTWRTEQQTGAATRAPGPYVVPERANAPIATGTRLPVSIIDRTEVLGTRYLDTRWQALVWPRFDNPQNEGIWSNRPYREPMQRLLEQIEIDRLTDKVARATFPCAAAALVVAIGGHHHDRQIRPPRLDLTQ